MQFRVLSFALVCLVFFFARIQEGCAHPVRTGEAVARPSGGPNGAVFLTLQNTTPRDEQLSGAESPVCVVTELHDHVREESGGQVRWRMRAIPALDLPAQQAGQGPVSVVLASGGKHIMLMQLRHPLGEGDTFPLTLRFRESPPVTVTVRVTRDVPLQ